jgi:hypothetical protein
MQQEPTAPSPTSETMPVSPKRRRGAFITGAVLVVLVAGGLAVGLTPNHLGIPLPGVSNATTANGTSDTQKTGCPSATANVTWSHSPTTTLQFNNADSVTNMHDGDTVQIDLQATQYRWTVTQITGKAVTMLAPAGYYDTANNTCDWRFTAHSSGTAVIQFLRRCNLASNRICSDIQIEVPFTVKVA